ncbi:hypothetical protein [Azoarcus indigens]|nr:hypothetical protein [Azoarcus indigens]
MNTIYERIREGIWAAGKHYKRTGQRTLWINLSAADEWIENSPHVEVSVPVKALKSGKARAGSGFA